MGTTYIFISGYGCCYSVSPNPASTEVTITVTGTGSGRGNPAVGNAVYDVTVYDIYGIIQSRKKYSGDRFTIPVYNLKDGNYIIKIDSGKFISVKQLIIKH